MSSVDLHRGSEFSPAPSASSQKQKSAICAVNHAWEILKIFAVSTGFSMNFYVDAGGGTFAGMTQPSISAVSGCAACLSSSTWREISVGQNV